MSPATHTYFKKHFRGKDPAKGLSPCLLPLANCKTRRPEHEDITRHTSARSLHIPRTMLDLWGQRTGKLCAPCPHVLPAWLHKGREPPVYSFARQTGRQTDDNDVTCESKFHLAFVEFAQWVLSLGLRVARNGKVHIYAQQRWAVRCHDTVCHTLCRLVFMSLVLSLRPDTLSQVISKAIAVAR